MEGIKWDLLHGLLGVEVFLKIAIVRIYLESSLVFILAEVVCRSEDARGLLLP